MSGYTFAPDYAIPPGYTLRDTLEERHMTQTELACRMGRPRKTINGIIHGKVQITPETALELERVLGIPTRIWLALESNYSADLARIAETNRLTEKVNWLKKFPITEMVKHGWITSTDPLSRLRELLSFLGVAYPDVWETLWQEEKQAFRMAAGFSAKNNPYALAIWLRAGERQAMALQCEPYSEEHLKRNIAQLRQATRLSINDSVRAMTMLCAEAGIAVVFEPELQETHICGASYWVAPHKAVIELSMRYKRMDSLWFTFFHEVGHILLHGKTEIFLDNDERAENLQKEREADAFACDTLIPMTAWKTFTQEQSFSEETILAFAKEQHIGSDIVVGRLQHEQYIPYSMFTYLHRSPIGTSACTDCSSCS